MAKPVYTGNHLPSCPSCGRSRCAPFRVYGTDGKAMLGCIDDYHTGHLYGESARWHSRPAAKAHRAQVKRHLTTLGIRYETAAERAAVAADPRA